MTAVAHADPVGRSVRHTVAAAPRWAHGLVGMASVVALLELVPRAGLVSAEHFPPFSVIVLELAAEATSPMFWYALYETVRAWAIGLGMAATAGVVLGVLIGSIAWLRTATHSTIEFLRPIPSVALVPLAVLLFGTDLSSKLLLIGYASFWPVLIQVLYGVQDVDPVASQTAASFRFRPWARLRYVTYPTVLPYLMTGMRLSAAIALILAVTGELVIGSPGIGQQIAVAQSSGAVPTMYALILVTGLIGVLVNAGARWLERRALAWHPSMRGEVVA